MVKLSVLITIFTFVLLVANAKAYPGCGTSRECRRQMQKQDMSQCMEYVRQQMNWEVTVLTLRGIDNTEQCLRECCNQLMEMDNRCQCEALKQMMSHEMQEEEMRVEDIKKTAEKIDNLPTICNSESKRCGFQPWF